MSWSRSLRAIAVRCRHEVWTTCVRAPSPGSTNSARWSIYVLVSPPNLVTQFTRKRKRTEISNWHQIRSFKFDVFSFHEIKFVFSAVIKESMRKLSTTTHVLSDPARLPDEARQAVHRSSSMTSLSSLSHSGSSASTPHSATWLTAYAITRRILFLFVLSLNSQSFQLKFYIHLSICFRTKSVPFVR